MVAVEREGQDRGTVSEEDTFLFFSHQAVPPGAPEALMFACGL